MTKDTRYVLIQDIIVRDEVIINKGKEAKCAEWGPSPRWFIEQAAPVYSTSNYQYFSKEEILNTDFFLEIPEMADSSQEQFDLIENFYKKLRAIINYERTVYLIPQYNCIRYEYFLPWTMHDDAVHKFQVQVTPYSGMFTVSGQAKPEMQPGVRHFETIESMMEFISKLKSGEEK